MNGHHDYRYIQGERFLGSNTNYDSTVLVDVDQPLPDTATLRSMGATTTTPNSLQARFVGQGYKQVTLTEIKF